MIRLNSVNALPGYSLELEYANGTAGEVNLAHLVGKGVFTAWEDESCFQQVRIAESGELVWPGEIDLCADSLYLQLTGLTATEAFADEAKTGSHA